MESEKKYKCTYENCTAIFSRPYRLSQHKLVHENVRKFTCDEDNCKKAYTSKSHLIRHVNMTHKRPTEDVIYSCPTCLKKFSNRQNLKKHIKVIHELNEYFKCTECSEEFKKKHLLFSHMYRHTGVKPFPCELCAKTFVTQLEKKKHLRRHKSYKCDDCAVTFTNFLEYQTHKREGHINNKFVCEHCNTKFKDRNSILRHMKLHNIIQIFYCPHEGCGRSYSRRSNLKQHMQVIHENRTFDCTVCNAKLSSNAKLKYHMNLHLYQSGEKRVTRAKPQRTARKERKDKGTIRTNTALDIAGIPRTKTTLPVSDDYNDSEDEHDISDGEHNGSDDNCGQEMRYINDNCLDVRIEC